MKKITIYLVFLLLLFSTFTGTSEDKRKKSFTWTKIQDITNTRYFIWQGDTIDFKVLADSLFLTRADSNEVFITLKQLSDMEIYYNYINAKVYE